MHRPPLATWFTSLVQRLPLKDLPSREQIQLAKELVEQPDAPWCSISQRTAHAVVWAQGQQPATDSLPAELVAALTWDRCIVKPAPLELMAIQRDNQLADSALEDLAQLPGQTVYMLVEQPLLGEGAAFMNGVWLMKDVDHESGAMKLVLLFDLLIGGRADRTMLLQLPVASSFALAIETAADDWGTLIADAADLARRNAERTTLLAIRPVLAALHATFVAGAARVEEARAMGQRDELDFILVDLSGAPARPAAGLFH